MKIEYNIIQIIIYFITYSFLGWAIESAYRSICEKKIINSGFLKGPACPIYGFGAIIMLIFLKQFENKTEMLFLTSFAILTVWEYLVAIFLEKVFHTKYWDYSHAQLNFQGRICLLNSFYWGILGVVFIKYIHPFIEILLGTTIDEKIIIPIYAILGIIMITDTITSTIKIKNITSTLQKIEKLNNEIKEKLKEINGETILRKGKEEQEAIKENIEKIIDQLNNQKQKIAIKLYKNVKRIKRAFPDIDTKEIREVLAKKLELKELTEKIKARKNNKNNQ